MQQQYKAFTVKLNSRANSLSTPCGVCEGISVKELKSGVPHPKVSQYIAIWDTGAEMSSISYKIINELGLRPIGKGKNSTANGVVDVYIYAINILLPCGVSFASIPVSGNDLGDVDMLIGMDIITKGDFSITNVNNKTVFSFRIPSCETIDYTEQNQPQSQPVNTSSAPPPDELCPCGCGKMFKDCHGKGL